jgi:LAO/AO transport system kinase
LGCRKWAERVAESIKNNTFSTSNRILAMMKHFEDHHKREHDHSALEVSRGIAQPPVVNPHYKRAPRRMLSTDDYVEGILAGNITILSRAITLVESLLPEHYAQAQEIIERCLPHTGRSIRIGITGVPGAGKSTFIEAIGNMITGLKHKLCVLAIDPSSERSGGSILGDKTRMETLVHNPDAFIRPSPSAGSLGGVARKTRETIVLCEAAGFDVVFVETVGVGQSETAVHSMVDLFLLLQIAGAGDELQGIKRGIMEMADMVAITKADGNNVQRAEVAKSHFVNALNLFPMPDSGWKPKVYTSSSKEKTGLRELWGGVEDFLKFTKQNGYFVRNRNRQSRYWMYETIDEALKDSFYRSDAIERVLPEMERAVLEHHKSSFVAAKELLDLYFKRDTP